MKFICLLVPYLLLVLFHSCTTNKPEGKMGAVFPKAAVVSAYPDASQVGADIMKKGANAVDAAVAVSFALAVVLPAAGNIGGGGFMVLRLTNGETNTLDFREKAPAAATKDMYLDSAGNVIPNGSLTGQRASGVPGTVAGMYEAHKKYGKLPWREVIQPAIDLARSGFKITKSTADDLNALRDVFIKNNPGKNYLLSNQAWKEEVILKQEDLAKTLELIRDNGRDGFYEGITAQHLVEEMRGGNGLITLDDLHNYQPIWRKPITGTYRGYSIITMPPPSSGGIALMQLLKMVEPFPIRQMGFHTTESIHLITEAESRVYADRATWLGDPDFFHVPITQLLDSIYIAKRLSNYNSKQHELSSSVKAGEIIISENNQTTHYSIVDQWGNAVAVTTTLNDGYGSKIFVKDAGFLLNNEMDDFSIKPGVPNMFGLVGGIANAIEPNKRMLSSMTPTIVTKDGKLFMVVGSPGGSTIITTVFQTIINVVDYGMTMQESVNASRFHSQWLPDKIMVESAGLDSLIIQQLKGMGHEISNVGGIGRCDAILVLPDGKYETGADKRGDDSPSGW